MARKPNPRIQAIWHARVSRQVISGLSIAEFCAKERCANSAFYRWKRLLNSLAEFRDAPGHATFVRA